MALTIPKGTRTVKVSVISPNRVLGVPASDFLTPNIKGTAYNDTPCLAFLVEHHDASNQSTTRLLFDLGIRKDWENSPPAVVDAVRGMDIQIETKKDTVDVLVENDYELSSINAVVFSHWHFDHTGDVNRLLPSTDLVIGPGFKRNMLPGYPTDPTSMVDESAFQRHKIIELSFDERPTIAGLRYLDWFGDGSFYLLDTPGHAVGHISALARTSTGASGDDSFVLLAGDVCHHAGELRPSLYRGLPDDQSKYLAAHPCQHKSMPYYSAAPGGFNMDAEEMQRTVEKVQKLDSDPNVYTILSHDNWLLAADIIELLPSTINDWRSRDLADRSRWLFLQDFDLKNITT